MLPRLPKNNIEVLHIEAKASSQTEGTAGITWTSVDLTLINPWGKVRTNVCAVDTSTGSQRIVEIIGRDKDIHVLSSA